MIDISAQLDKWCAQVRKEAREDAPYELRKENERLTKRVADQDAELECLRQAVVDLTNRNVLLEAEMAEESRCP